MYRSDEAHWNALLNYAHHAMAEKPRRGDNAHRGGQYFSPLCVARIGETQLARILASLLDPAGMHGLNRGILDSFLDLLRIGKPDLSIDYVAPGRPVVEVEVGTGGEGRIDILVHNGRNDWALAIELKINAADQPAQIGRYLRYLRNRFKPGRWRLLYLTPDGSPPSPASITRQEFWKAVDAGEAYCMAFCQIVNEGSTAAVAGVLPIPPLDFMIGRAYGEPPPGRHRDSQEEIYRLLKSLKTGSPFPEMDETERKCFDKLGSLIISDRSFIDAALDIREALDQCQARVIGGVRNALRRRVESLVNARSPEDLLYWSPADWDDADMRNPTNNLLVWRRRWETGLDWPKIILEGTESKAPPWRNVFLGIRLLNAPPERKSRFQSAFRELVELDGREIWPNDYNVVGRHLTEESLRDWTTTDFLSLFGPWRGNERRLDEPMSEHISTMLDTLASQIVQAISAVDAVLANEQGDGMPNSG